MADINSSNKRIVKNTIALYVRMMIQTFIGLYTSRIILDALGVDDFGVYNVIGSVTLMLTFINTSMANATMRFITFEEGCGNSSKLNSVFCTSVNIHLIIALFVFILIEALGLWFLDNKMVISPERLTAATWVLHFSAITCVFDIISVPYNACIIAHEKMSAFAYISILQQGSILLLSLLLHLYDGDRLVLYALIIMLIQVLVRFCYGYYCKKNFAETKYRFCFDKKQTIEMAQFAGWTLNGNLAWMGYTQGLNLLINIFCGPAVNAARGIAFTVQAKVMSFCGNFQLAVNPQITKKYAAGEYEKMHGLIISSSKFSYYLLLVVSLPLLIGIDTILEIWLKTVPEYTVEFVQLILICSLIDIFKSPMNTAIHATGKIKVFQLWEATSLLFIVPLAYWFLNNGYPVQYVFIVQLIVFLIVMIERIFLVCPRIYMAKSVYVKQVIFPTALVTLYSLIIPFSLSYFWPIESKMIIHQFFHLFLIFVSTCLIVFFFGLEKKERDKVMSICKIRFGF